MKNWMFATIIKEKLQVSTSFQLQKRELLLLQFKITLFFPKFDQPPYISKKAIFMHF